MATSDRLINIHCHYEHIIVDDIFRQNLRSIYTFSNSMKAYCKDSSVFLSFITSQLENNIRHISYNSRFLTDFSILDMFFLLNLSSGAN